MSITVYLDGCSHHASRVPDDSNFPVDHQVCDEEVIKPIESEKNITTEPDTETNRQQETSKDICLSALEIETSNEQDYKMLASDDNSKGETKPCYLHIPLNPVIQRRINTYLTKRRRDLISALEKGSLYIPMIEKQLEERSLPQELKWIPVVESGYNIHARSPRCAKGMWQLMPTTARKFGIRIDEWIDERVDPEKSTETALNILSYLYQKLDCWLLALAAYNAGEGKIFEAMERTGSRDFWKLYESKAIPPQTRYYVTAILALQHIDENADIYGIPRYANAYTVDVIPLDNQIDLEVVSRCAGTDINIISNLNPALKRRWTPPNYPGFQLKIPVPKKAECLKNLEKIPQKDYLRWETHEVIPGDTLSFIAAKYGSTIPEIMRSNGLTKTLIRAGWTLVVPIGIVDPN
ncbi:transglycosylase SLT domain-containing protein [bacterium]|nr:transglycosylase SLT domain-containing protein [candidate division CSSED10-310 bacterium]